MIMQKKANLIKHIKSTRVIAAILRHKRTESGLSQKKFAEGSRLNVSTVAEIELGVAQTDYNLKSYCFVLNISRSDVTTEMLEFSDWLLNRSVVMSNRNADEIPFGDEYTSVDEARQLYEEFRVERQQNQLTH
jgi:transcriptional regulator with XRE-family HTH domain